jgi:hypothetical protein
MRTSAYTIALLSSLLAVAPAYGQSPGSRTWSVSPYVGLHQPNLKELNKGEFRAPYEGTAQILNPVGNNQQGTFSYNTPLPEFDPGTLTGLELNWRINERHTLLIGGATWQATSTASSRGLFPVQGSFESISAVRKASLSYNEYYLGWRYNLAPRRGKYRFYFSASLHQIYDMDYREDFTTVFLSGPPRTFRKTIVIQAQSTGLTLLQGMAGGEWFFTDWLSLGLEGGYSLPFNKAELAGLGTTPIRSDFLATDNVQVQPPMLLDLQSRRLMYKSEPGGAYERLRLSFDGWKTLMKVTLYF